MSNPSRPWTDLSRWITEHRRAVALGLLGFVAVLTVVAGSLALGLMRDLPATGGAPSDAPRPTRLPSESPASTPEPSIATDGPTATATDEPTPIPTSVDEAHLADGWIEVGSFGEDETIDAVHDVVRAPFGLLAAGVHIETRNLPVFGPLAQQGRIWLSTDGRSWQDVTPDGGTFADSSVYDLAVLTDGTVVAFVRVSAVDAGIPTDAYAAWETEDGRTWTGVEEMSAGSGPVLNVVQGAAGYLAWRNVPNNGGVELWHSVDGRSYELRMALSEGRVVASIAAGPEGFVVVSRSVEGSASSMMHASGDGIDWFEAPGPADAVAGITAIGPDWVAVDGTLGDGDTSTWTSANGLDWTASGTIPRRTEPLGDDAVCTEFTSRLLSSGSFAVVSTVWSYPCGEGHVQHFGAAHVTADGATWGVLPFTAGGLVTDGSTRGTTVNVGLDLEDGTLLAGEKDYRATFWFRPED